MKITSISNMKKEYKDKELYIPMLQREYVWRQPQWGKLWKDILNLYFIVCDDENSTAQHFMGIVTIKGDCSAKHNGKSRCAIIDGQQRITTLKILLDFLYDLKATKSKGIFEEKSNNPIGITFSGLNVECKNVGERGVDSADNKDVYSLAYGYFAENYAYSTEELSVEYLISIVENRLLFDVVEVSEDGDEYATFEGLNATGKPVEFVDLVLNYLVENRGDCEPNTIRDRFHKVCEQIYSGILPDDDENIDLFMDDDAFDEENSSSDDLFDGEEENDEDSYTVNEDVCKNNIKQKDNSGTIVSASPLKFKKFLNALNSLTLPNTGSVQTTIEEFEWIFKRLKASDKEFSDNENMDVDASYILEQMEKYITLYLKVITPEKAKEISESLCLISQMKKANTIPASMRVLERCKRKELSPDDAGRIFDVMYIGYYYKLELLERDNCNALGKKLLMVDYIFAAINELEKDVFPYLVLDMEGIEQRLDKFTDVKEINYFRSLFTKVAKNGEKAVVFPNDNKFVVAFKRDKGRFVSVIKKECEPNADTYVICVKRKEQVNDAKKELSKKYSIIYLPAALSKSNVTLNYWIQIPGKEPICPEEMKNTVFENMEEYDLSEDDKVLLENTIKVNFLHLFYATIKIMLEKSGIANGQSVLDEILHSEIQENCDKPSKWIFVPSDYKDYGNTQKDKKVFTLIERYANECNSCILDENDQLKYILNSDNGVIALGEGIHRIYDKYIMKGGKPFGMWFEMAHKELHYVDGVRYLINYRNLGDKGIFDKFLKDKKLIGFHKEETVHDGKVCSANESKPKKLEEQDYYLEAGKKNLCEFFSVELHIPEYQREYVWRTQNFEVLQESLKIAFENKRKINLGTIILAPVKVGSRTQINIVDGQQRLTTLATLISCTHSDKNLKFVQGLLKDETKVKWETALKYWSKSSLSSDTNVDFSLIEFNVICQKSDIKDDLFQYKIFDSINGDGIKLNASEKIHNYMHQNYNLICKNVCKDNSRIRTDIATENAKLIKNIVYTKGFIKAYVEMKTKKHVSEKGLYDEFKKLVQQGNIQLEELEKYLSVYKYIKGNDKNNKFRACENEKSYKEFIIWLRIFQQIKTSTADAVLISLFGKYDNVDEDLVAWLRRLCMLYFVLFVDDEKGNSKKSINAKMPALTESSIDEFKVTDKFKPFDDEQLYKKSSNEMKEYLWEKICKLDLTIPTRVHISRFILFMLEYWNGLGYEELYHLLKDKAQIAKNAEVEHIFPANPEKNVWENLLNSGFKEPENLNFLENVCLLEKNINGPVGNGMLIASKANEKSKLGYFCDADNIIKEQKKQKARYSGSKYSFIQMIDVMAKDGKNTYKKMYYDSTFAEERLKKIYENICNNGLFERTLSELFSN